MEILEAKWVVIWGIKSIKKRRFLKEGSQAGSLGLPGYIIPTMTKLPPPRLKEVPLGGLAAPQTPLLPWGGEAPPDPPPGGCLPRTPATFSLCS